MKGHIDAVVDDQLVDFKSASSYSYRKFEDGLVPENDAFGYLTQLDGYHHAIDTGSDEHSFVVIDKQLGKITLDTHKKSEVDYEALVSEKRAMLASKEPPPRGYRDEPEGKSGNRKLCVTCSYCPFKNECWPGLRTFAYSTGPVFLTRVIKEPKVKDITNAVE